MGRGQVRPEECKVKVMRDFARPITKTDIRSFLVLTTYYRNFVDHYVDNSVALTAATRKAAPTTVEWTLQMEDEFRYIKDSLCCVPFLIIPTEDDPSCSRLMPWGQALEPCKVLREILGRSLWPSFTESCYPGSKSTLLQSWRDWRW